LQLVWRAEGCSAKVFTTHCVKRSKYKIPEFIESSRGYLISYIGTVDGLNSYQITTFERSYYDTLSK
jgi:hypothetical protein